MQLFACRFRVPEGIPIRILFYCHPSTIKNAAESYQALTPIADLLAERKSLTDALKQPISPQERKKVQGRINEISVMLNQRSSAFLNEPKKNKAKENKYSNYRVVPDKDGIRKVLPGGESHQDNRKYKSSNLLIVMLDRKHVFR